MNACPRIVAFLPLKSVLPAQRLHLTLPCPVLLLRQPGSAWLGSPLGLPTDIAQVATEWKSLQATICFFLTLQVFTTTTTFTMTITKFRQKYYLP